MILLYSPIDILLLVDKMSNVPLPQYLSAPVKVGSPVLDTRNRSPVQPVVGGRFISAQFNLQTVPVGQTACHLQVNPGP